MILSPPVFRGLRIKAFFTTKGLNPDSELHAISKITGTPLNSIYLPIQKHTDKVMALDNDLQPKIADAVITNRNGILIGVQVADCVPILLHDRKRNAIAAIHAGWRGTASEILKKTINAMSERFFSSPSDMVIALGPSIRWCCYGVGHEVIDAVKRATGRGEYIIRRADKYCLDLPTANRYQALSTGVLPENIWMSDECTFCLPEKYYSYRFSKGITGRQYGFIGIFD